METAGRQKKSNLTVFLVPILLLVAVPSTDTWAQRLRLDPEQRYLLLATTRTSTMQKELDEAAALGFRVLAGSPTSDEEMAVFLERVAQPPDTYNYLLLATTRTSTMQKELDEAARKGFRLLPQTMISKKGAWGGDEVVVLLERSPKAGKRRYEYKLLATSRTSTLQKEVSQAADNGFVIAGMVSREEHMVIMEKAVIPNGT